MSVPLSLPDSTQIVAGLCPCLWTVDFASQRMPGGTRLERPLTHRNFKQVTHMITRFMIAVALVTSTAGLVRAQGYGRSQPRTSQPTQPTSSQPQQPQQQQKEEHVVVSGGSDVTTAVHQYVEAAGAKSS